MREGSQISLRLELPKTSKNLFVFGVVVSFFFPFVVVVVVVVVVVIVGISVGSDALPCYPYEEIADVHEAYYPQR